MSKLSSPKAWSKAIAQPAQEFPLTPLSVLSGTLPPELRGSLYRNGPGRLQQGNQRVGHWFDGDGAILGVHFTEEGATATYRYVQTPEYQQECKEEQYLYPNYGMTVPGLFWKTWGKEIKHAANTSVLALPHKLLALWEGGHPYRLDLHTLETKRKDSLSALEKNETFSAHPKRDPITGGIFNFGISPGVNATLNLYKSDVTGKIIRKNKMKLSGVPLVHDFAIAGKYLIFFVSPVRLNLLPTALGLASFSDMLKWQPNLGTQVLVFDKETLSLVSHSEADPWFQWHYGNGYEEPDGSVVVNLISYRNFHTNQYLKEVATGITKTSTQGIFSQVRLNPQTGRIMSREPLCDRGCEFPIVNPQNVGQPHDYTYLSMHREGANYREDFMGTIACFNHQNNQLSTLDCGENNYPSEPIYINNPSNPDQDWLISVVYNGNLDQSEVWIVESHHLEQEPICCLQLPQVIPPSFHGTWRD